jgi:hypothetical protein
MTAGSIENRSAKTPDRGITIFQEAIYFAHLCQAKRYESTRSPKIDRTPSDSLRLANRNGGRAPNVLAYVRAFCGRKRFAVRSISNTTAFADCSPFNTSFTCWKNAVETSS